MRGERAHGVRRDVGAIEHRHMQPEAYMARSDHALGYRRENSGGDEICIG
jgi:hypothetical protein